MTSQLRSTIEDIQVIDGIRPIITASEAAMQYPRLVTNRTSVDTTTSSTPDFIR